MRFGSICSGIEAASVAFSPLGWTPAWLAEVDVAASLVLAHRLGATAPRHIPGDDKAALKRIERERDKWGDSIVNWGDFTRLPEAVLAGEAEAPDVLCGGTPCFTAGHMVLTEAGHKRIEDVRPGDMVATHKGRFRRVLRIGSKPAPVGDWRAVGHAGGVRCTADHPFYVARDLSRSTRVSGKGAHLKNFGPMEWVAADKSVGMLWAGLRELSGEERLRAIPQPHGLSRRETMRLIGWYLGDGWIREWASGKKALCLGLSDAKVAAFRSSFPNLKQAAVDAGTTKRIAIGCTDFCDWLSDNFGHHALHKTIPGWVLGDPDRQELLAGYIATDGHIAKNGIVVVNSVSEALARGAAALSQTLGYVASVTLVKTTDRTTIQGRTVLQKDYFACRMCPDALARKSHSANGFILRRVQSFSPVGTEMVFNIEVEEDNSFVLNGAVVHNCQSYSIAGRREGLEDSRGQLTLKFVELADAIDTKRAERGEPPCIVFWENVPGVLSSKDNAFGCFLADLAGEDLPLEPPGGRWSNAGVVLGPKRAIAWIVKDAQYFGVAQRRARVFVVASAREGFDPAAVLFEFDGLRRDSAPSREAWQDVAGTLASRTDGGGFPGTDEACSGYVQPVERPRSADLSVIAMAHGQGGAEISVDRCPTLTCNHEAPIAAYSVALRGREGGATAELGDDVAGTLRASGGGDKPHVLAFSCKDYGADATLDLAPTMRAMGHDGSHANAGGQLAVCVTGDITHTLTAEGFDASEDGTGREQPIVPCNFQSSQSGVRLNETVGTLDANYGPRRHNGVLTADMAVRRLMPVECERLQGFDDNWTLVPSGKATAADGPRYKQLGNSWAVPCVRWIGARIDAHVRELDTLQIEAAYEIDLAAWVCLP